MFFNDLCFTTFVYLFILPFCSSFPQHILLHTYFMTGITLATKDPEVNETDKVPTLMKLTFYK